MQSETHPSQGVVDQSDGRGSHFDERTEHPVLGLAEERGEAGEEFGAAEVSEIEDRVFAGGWRIEFY